MSHPQATVPDTITPAASALRALTINDLADAVKIIDTASKRGAWEGSELLAVGSVRQKFVDFCNAYSTNPAAAVGPTLAAPAAAAVEKPAVTIDTDSGLIPSS